MSEIMERDFTKEKLNSKEVDIFSTWCKVEKVAISQAKLNVTFTGVESLEEKLKKTIDDVAKANGNKDRGDVLRATPPASRTREQKDELTDLGTAKDLLAVVTITMSLQALALAEKEKNDNACIEYDKFIASTVMPSLNNEYLSAVLEHPNDRLKQVLEGRKKLKAMMTVALKDVEISFATEVLGIQLQTRCGTMDEVTAVIDKLNEIKLKSKGHKEMFGGDDRVTDELMVQTLWTVVKSTKHNDIVQEVQAVLTAAKLSKDPVPWAKLSKEIGEIVRTLSISEEMEKKRTQDGKSDMTSFAAIKTMNEAVDARVNERFAQLQLSNSMGAMAFNAIAGQQQPPMGYQAYAAGGQVTPWKPQQQQQQQQNGGGVPARGARQVNKNAAVCFAWDKGKLCLQDGNCRFNHASENFGLKQNTQGQNGGGNERGKRKGTCWSWQRDGCKDRNSCLFQHPESEKGIYKKGNQSTTTQQPKGGNSRSGTPIPQGSPSAADQDGKRQRT